MKPDDFSSHFSGILAVFRFNGNQHDFTITLGCRPSSTYQHCHQHPQLYPETTAPDGLSQPVLLDSLRGTDIQVRNCSARRRMSICRPHPGTSN